MTRVKGGIQTKQNHKKVLKLAKGFWMSRHKQIKKATEAVLHAGQYAFNGRKRKKRDIRALWIIRINAGLKLYDLSYSSFIKKLKDKEFGIDRKILAKFATEYPKVFEKVVNTVKS